MDDVTTLKELLEKQNAILIKNLSENPSLEKWQQMGKPKILILTDKCGDYELYDEIGYGHLFLVQNGIIVSWSQSDFVQSPDMQIIGLGPYYGYEPSALFKRLPWYFVNRQKGN